MFNRLTEMGSPRKQILGGVKQTGYFLVLVLSLCRRGEGILPGQCKSQLVTQGQHSLGQAHRDLRNWDGSQSSLSQGQWPGLYTPAWVPHCACLALRRMCTQSGCSVPKALATRGFCLQWSMQPLTFFKGNSG